MEGEKDRFGETMRLLEKAKEDIYFADRLGAERGDRERVRNQAVRSDA